jgi:adenylate cyclase
MSTEESKRKLSAILSADVKGYSRLMSQDEEATVKTLKHYRLTISGFVSDHRGRVVDSPGDNILAEFGSVVDAVKCAVKIQETLKGTNAEVPQNRRMEFRIGVNLGDVIEEEDRIYGDGVNITARMEGLADGGGICISGTAFDQVKNKLSVGYQYLGKQTVKNIPDPVRAYKVLMEPEAAGKVIGEVEPKQTKWGWKAFAAMAVLVLVAGIGIWNFYWRAPKIEPASKEKMAFPLPDKPSIAVLPFANMTGDPTQEFLPDGITENIITTLSASPSLFVIARNSTFAYKGKSVRVQQVAEELGVRYVLEGSVARSGDRIRVTAQLIDALKGHHLWAERYDRELKDLFALQDDLAKKILRGIGLKLTHGEDSLHGRQAKNIEVTLKLFQAGEYLRAFNIDGNNRARLIAGECMALEPDHWGNYWLLGSVHQMDYHLGSTKDPAKSLQTAIEYLEKAVALSDDSKGRVYSQLGYLYALKREYDKAIELGEKGIAIVPNGADAHAWLAMSLTSAGRAQEAISLFEKAMRLNPLPPAFYYLNFGHAYRILGRFEEAVAMYKKTIALTPNNIFAYIGLAGTHGLMGKEEEAKAAAAEVLRINPKWSIEQYAKTTFSGDKARLIEAFRKAGLPDKPPLPLPDKPSIAVLPFVNMSDDKSQEYFSDGLTEEIITALSKTPKVFVIARNSTFVYKGKPVNVQQVSRELGVKYVLEGSVRRSGEQLRITAQLIDATTGNHLWAERYDREMKDVFAIQDNITLEIMKALEVKLSRGEMQGKSTETLEAYLKILQVSDFLYQFNKESNVRARELAEEAIRLDPNFARAYYGLAAITHLDVMLGLSKSPKDSRMKAIELCQKATSLDNTLAGAYGLLGYLYVQIGDYEKGIQAGERAIEVGPSSADAHSLLAQVLNFSGRAQEAIALNEKAFRLNPVGPTTYYYTHASFSYILTGRYEDAVKMTKQELSRSPNNVLAHARLVWALSAWGHDEEAKTAAQSVLRIDPKFSAKRLASSLNFKDPSVAPSYLEHMLKAGLPE